MSIRRRIMLIAAGLIVFGVTGPLLIVIAQGYSIDWENRRLLPSGTLVVRTEPREATVSINGDPSYLTPLTKRFLPPGEYAIKIEKPRYQLWQRRIEILPGQVVYLPRSVEKIAMFFAEPKLIQATTSVADFFLSGEILYHIDNETRRIFQSPLAGGTAVATAPALNFASQMKISDVRDIDGLTNFILSDESGKHWLFASGQTTQLPAMSRPRFASDGTVLGISDKNELIEISGRVQTIRQKNILAFAEVDRQFYVLKRDNDGQIWLYLETGSNLEQLIRAPELVSAEIEIAYYNNGEFLIFGDSHQAWIYRLDASGSEVRLARANTPHATSIYNDVLGNSLFIENNEVRAIEEDRTDQPNNYLLYSGQNPKKIDINEAGDTVIILDNRDLRIIRIR